MPHIRFFSWSDPPSRSQAITKSDTTLLPRGVRGFIVGEGGDVSLEFADGTTDVWPSVQAGVIYPCLHLRRIRSTGTTASNIHVVF